jgi:hypothetical protein
LFQRAFPQITDLSVIAPRIPAAVLIAVECRRRQPGKLVSGEVHRPVRPHSAHDRWRARVFPHQPRTRPEKELGAAGIPYSEEAELFHHGKYNDRSDGPCDGNRSSKQSLLNFPMSAVTRVKFSDHLPPTARQLAARRRDHLVIGKLLGQIPLARNGLAAKTSNAPQGPGKSCASPLRCAGVATRLYEIPITSPWCPSRKHMPVSALGGRSKVRAGFLQTLNARQGGASARLSAARTELRVGRSTQMLDLIMLAIGLSFFALSIGYVYACDQL